MMDENNKVPTMLGGEGPEWLVISGPRYRASGAHTWVEQLHDRKEENKNEVGVTPLETFRLRSVMPPAEVARRYHVDRKKVIGLEKEEKRVDIFTWLRLYGFYGYLLGVQYIDKGGDELEESYITLLNVNIRRFEGNIEEAALKTRKQFFTALRKKHIKREGI